MLGLLHTASCAVVYFAAGVGARTVLGVRPTAALIVTRVSAVAWGPSGQGVTSTVLHDLGGAVGHAQQMLTVRPQPAR